MYTDNNVYRLVPPYAAVIHGIHNEENESVIRGIEDQNVTLSCSAYGAKPKPYMTWAIAELNMTFDSTVDATEHANGTFDVTAVYTFVANRHYDRLELTCSIGHPTLDTPLEKDAFLILYRKFKLQYMNKLNYQCQGALIHRSLSSRNIY